MFVREIVQEIVIHFSFDMIRMFASFSGHTLSDSVEVLTNRCLELQKNIGGMAFRSDESVLLFLLQRR